MSLSGSAIAPQANGAEQIMHLLTREDGGKGVVIFGADLGEDRPPGRWSKSTKNILAPARAWRMVFGFQCFWSLTKRR